MKAVSRVLMGRRPRIPRAQQRLVHAHPQIIEKKTQAETEARGRSNLVLLGHSESDVPLGVHNQQPEARIHEDGILQNNARLAGQAQARDDAVEALGRPAARASGCER